jgi:hypothetical protein
VSSSDLTKLLDRNFAAGYFLPVVAFIAASLSLVAGFGQLPELGTTLSNLTAGQIAVITTVIGLISALGGILLVVTNRDIIRLMEGYWPFNLHKSLAWIERRRYRKRLDAIYELRRQEYIYYSKRKDVPPELASELTDLEISYAERFPEVEELVLPTAFGNTIRAFERYSSVMYGLDAIPGWDRLLGVIPKDYRELVDTAKGNMDFWVNTWLLSLLFVLEYIGFAVYGGQFKMLWVLPIALGITFIASFRARSAAAEWGNTVKAAFDVFLPELRKKLEFSPTATMDEERQLWIGFSQAILRRDARTLANRIQLPQEARLKLQFEEPEENH